MRISDWSSDVCSSDVDQAAGIALAEQHRGRTLEHLDALDIRQVEEGFVGEQLVVDHAVAREGLGAEAAEGDILRAVAAGGDRMHVADIVPPVERTVVLLVPANVKESCWDRVC